MTRKIESGGRRIDSLVVGECYFVTTARYDYVGRLLRIDGPYTMTLTEAAWVSETGRLSQFMRDGKADGMEIELLGGEGIVCCHWSDWRPWPHALFTEAV